MVGEKSKTTTKRTRKTSNFSNNPNANKERTIRILNEKQKIFKEEIENDLEKSRTELYKLIERMTEKYFKEFTASLPEEFLQMKYCDFINLCNDPSFKDKTCNFNDTLQTFADLREKAHDENASPTTRHRYQCIKDTLFK